MLLLLLNVVRVLALKELPCGWYDTVQSQQAAQASLSAGGVNAAAALVLHHQACSYSAA
jgi:hypothetical protein